VGGEKERKRWAKSSTVPLYFSLRQAHLLEGHTSRRTPTARLLNLALARQRGSVWWRAGAALRLCWWRRLDAVQLTHRLVSRRKRCSPFVFRKFVPKRRSHALEEEGRKG
jgi:hypothetical protein